MNLSIFKPLTYTTLSPLTLIYMVIKE